MDEEGEDVDDIRAVGGEDKIGRDREDEEIRNIGLRLP